MTPRHQTTPPDQVLTQARQLIGAWNYPEAVRLLADAHARPSRHTTPDLGDQIAVLYLHTLRETGQTATATTLAEQLFDDTTNRHGLTHPSTVQVLAVLGELYHDLARLDDADDCYHLVTRSATGAHHLAGPAVRRTAANQALLHYDRGHRHDALTALAAAYTALHRFDGAADPATLLTAAALAGLLHHHDRTAQARALLTGSLAAARAGLADQHPITIGLERHLAALHHAAVTSQHQTHHAATTPNANPTGPVTGPYGRSRPDPTRAPACGGRGDPNGLLAAPSPSPPPQHHSRPRSATAPWTTTDLARAPARGGSGERRQPAPRRVRRGTTTATADEMQQEIEMTGTNQATTVDIPTPRRSPTTPVRVRATAAGGALVILGVVLAACAAAPPPPSAAPTSDAPSPSRPAPSGPICQPPTGYTLPTPSSGTTDTAEHQLLHLAAQLHQSTDDDATGDHAYVRYRLTTARRTTTTGADDITVVDSEYWIGDDHSGAYTITHYPAEDPDPKPGTPGARTEHHVFPAHHIFPNFPTPFIGDRTAAPLPSTNADHPTGRDGIRGAVAVTEATTIPCSNRIVAIADLAALDVTVQPGAVDHAHRPGIAITADSDQHHTRDILIVDADTGTFLSYELQTLPGPANPAAAHTDLYLLFLANRRAPLPTAPPPGSPT